MSEELCTHERFNKDGESLRCPKKQFKLSLCHNHYYQYAKDTLEFINRKRVFPWKGNRDHWRDVYLIWD